MKHHWLRRYSGIRSWLRELVYDFYFLLSAARCDKCRRKLAAGDQRRICRFCFRGLLRYKVCYTTNRHSSPQGARSLFPHICRRCSHPLRHARQPCWVCRRNPLAVEQLRVLFFNSHLPQELFYAYKFRRYRSYALFLAACLEKRLGTFMRSFDVWVPITLTAAQVRTRDFCPVSIIVTSLAARLGVRIIPVIKRHTAAHLNLPAQHTLTLKERRRYVAARFYYDTRYTDVLTQQRVLIIDDIFTTGSTINVATNLIRKHNKVRTLAACTILRSVLMQTPATYRKPAQGIFTVKTTPNAFVRENWTLFT